MKIIYREGDLTKAPQGFICHGCNAQGKMGSGVAKAIREAFPYAYAAYREAYETKGLAVGDVIYATGRDGEPIVINAITQEYYGYDAREKGNIYLSYSGLRLALNRISRQMETWGLAGEEVAFPLIGAGLAGGDWTVIAESIEGERGFQPVVYYRREDAWILSSSRA